VASGIVTFCVGAVVLLAVTAELTITLLPEIFELLRTDRLRVGVHALGHVSPTTQQAIDDFFPGYARAIASIAKERGWPAVIRVPFDAQRIPGGRTARWQRRRSDREGRSVQSDAAG
jgi:hypothetical protein